MNSKLARCLALVVFSVSAQARLVRMWSDAELLKLSDLVVVGQPIKVKDVDETNSLGFVGSESFRSRFRGVETTFKVSNVLKGMPANDQVVLHHFRIEIGWGSPPNGPDLISFESNSTNKYLLYLINDGTNRYAPTAGQIDPRLSINPTQHLFPPGYDFPVPTPITDADPSVRLPVLIRVPTRLGIQRTEDSLAITFSSFESTNLTVGTNMVTGIQRENKIYRNGELLPWGGDGFLSGFDMASHLDSFNYVFTRSRDKIPQPGEHYVVEYQLTAFETDFPPQHMWWPQRGKHYKVLWTRTFKETIK